MKFDTVYIGVCSWCCEIVVGTKNSSLNSWQVVFFKHEKSTMENFYDPTINFYVPIRISLNYDKHFNFFFKGCSIFIEWYIYIYIYCLPGAQAVAMEVWSGWFFFFFLVFEYFGLFQLSNGSS